MNEYKKMSKGLFYNSAHKDLDAKHLHGLEGSRRFNEIPYTKPKKRAKALEKLIPSSKGKIFDVFSPFYCEFGYNIHLGNECFCNYNCTFLDVAPITFGDQVWVGANVVFATPSHPYLAEERIGQEYPDGYHDLEYAKPITVGDNVWICSSVTICGGVTIGENAIIAAGAVVTSDVPANSIVGGVPAKVIRMLDEDDRMNVWETYVNKEIPMSVRNKRKSK